MNKEHEHLSDEIEKYCPACESGDVSEAREVVEFQYGDKDDSPTLSATISVFHCAQCGFAYTTEEASEARHEAVCRYLRVMTPKEVRLVRERYGLSQADLAGLSKIGRASLARWESGALIQNQANDNLLYLLTFYDNVMRLRERARSVKDGGIMTPSNVVPFRPKFRALQTGDLDRLQREAERFELFPVAMSR